MPITKTRYWTTLIIMQNSYMGGAYIITNLPTTAWGSDSDQ